MAHGRYKRGYRRRHNPGLERARQHIEEARQLSAELGGTDKDVKDYFFRLPHPQLSALLDEYGRKHGADAKQYAVNTIGRWRTGAVQMGGQTASRLFALLPPRMPPAEKYRLTESLWTHVGPSSKKTLRIGIDADLAEILAAIAVHIESVVVNYRIPDGLERRFQWLSAGDVDIKQKLLNHLRQMEKRLVVEGAAAQLPTMLAHMKSEESENTRRLAQILKVGKHELDLTIDKTHSGVTLEDPRPSVLYPNRSSSSESEFGYWWLLVLAGIILFVILG
jgi:hypothetical protein